MRHCPSSEPPGEMSFLGNIIASINKESSKPLTAGEKELQQKEAENKKKLNAFRDKVSNHLKGFKAQKGCEPLRYPQSNLPYELRQIIFEEASLLGLTTDEFGKPGIDRFIMVFKNKPTAAELKALHGKHDVNDEEAFGAESSENGGGEGGGEGGEDAVQDEPPEEDNWEDQEDEEYPYQEHLDEEGFEYGDYETGAARPSHSSATRAAQSSQKVATRLPKRAEEKRASQRARMAAEADDDAFALGPRGGPKLSPAVHDEIDRKMKHDPQPHDSLSNSIKRKREEATGDDSKTEEHLAKKVKIEDHPT